MGKTIEILTKLTIALSCVMSGVTGIYAEETSVKDTEVQEDNRYSIKVSETKDIEIPEGTDITIINEDEEFISAEQKEAGILTVQGLGKTEDAVIRVIANEQEILLHFEVIQEDTEEILYEDPAEEVSEPEETANPAETVEPVSEEITEEETIEPDEPAEEGISEREEEVIEEPVQEEVSPEELIEEEESSEDPVQEEMPADEITEEELSEAIITEEPEEFIEEITETVVLIEEAPASEEIQETENEVLIEDPVVFEASVYSISVTGGTASVNGSTVKKAEENAKVTLSAASKSGYRFIGWLSSQVTVTNNIFTMPAQSVSVVAQYEKLPCWENTDQGVKYVLLNGKYASGWTVIGNEKYYFGDDNCMATGWTNIDGTEYCFSNEGILLKDTWYDDCWARSDGTKAKSEWVDGNEYYVNAKGKKVSWISYTALSKVQTSTRLGYYVAESYTPPEQSLASYDLAYEKGSRIMVADLRFTLDGVAVCSHNNKITYARKTDGTEPARYPSVSKLTLEQLQEYDYGLYKGKLYEGTKLLTLEEMCAWIKKHSDTKLYIEVKSLENGNVSAVTELLNKYGIVSRTSYITNYNDADQVQAMNTVHKQLPSLRLGLWVADSASAQITDDMIKVINKVNGDNEVFLWYWNTTQLTDEVVNKMSDKGVGYGFGILSKFGSMLSYFLQAENHMYASEIETRGLVFADELAVHSGNKAADIGFKQTNGNWYYLKSDNTKVTGWLLLEGDWYYFNAKGIMQTGWLELNGFRFWLGSNGKKATGYRTINSKKYYFDDSGVLYTGWRWMNDNWYYYYESGDNIGLMAKGWVKKDGYTYYMKSTGIRFAGGFLTVDGKKYYFNKRGEMQTGWLKYDGSWYYLNAKGAMVTGWKKIDGSWYYLKKTGEMATGWLKLSGYWYYLNESGRMVTGFKKINGKTYYFNSSGRMMKGWQKIGGYWYYLGTDGVRRYGWQKISSSWYWFDSSGIMVTGFRVIGKKTYYFAAGGKMVTGPLQIADSSYYFEKSGAMRTGWLWYEGSYYYYDKEGRMLYGWQHIGTPWYYFNEEGKMVRGLVWIDEKPVEFAETGELIDLMKLPEELRTTGWIEEDGGWKYRKDDLYYALGWLKLEKGWYYLKEDYTRAVGWMRIDDFWYNFDYEGVMRTGWIKTGDYWYYCSAGGKMQTGLKKISGKIYFFENNGVMAAGWKTVDGSTYYFKPKGAAATGMYTVDSKTYFFDEEGKMYKGWKRIDTDWYYFKADGTMAVSTTINGFKIGSDGRLITE